MGQSSAVKFYAIELFPVFPNHAFYMMVLVVDMQQGCFAQKGKAEMIPFEPEPVNTGGGSAKPDFWRIFYTLFVYVGKLVCRTNLGETIGYYLLLCFPSLSLPVVPVAVRFITVLHIQRYATIFPFLHLHFVAFCCTTFSAKHLVYPQR